MVKSTVIFLKTKEQYVGKNLSKANGFVSIDSTPTDGRPSVRYTFPADVVLRIEETLTP
jgi:hypothetical protein